MSLFEPYNLPFAVALGIMFLLALAQVLGVSDFGGDADLDVDAEVDHDLGIADGLMSFLGIGRLPLMMWLALFLFLFAAFGVGIQTLVASLIGAPLHPLLAAVLALVPALPTTGTLSRPLARVLPRDETTAIGLDRLVGRRGVITTGTSRKSSPARARVIDQFGHPHHVMVEPHEGQGEFHEGDEVLLVRREGEIFFGLGVAERLLSST